MPSMMFEDEIVLLGKDLVADGTSDVDTAVIDMQDVDEIEFRVWHGDVDAAAVMVYTVYENTASSTSSPSPTAVTLTGAAGTGASISSGALTITESSGNLDDKCIRINVAHQALSKRYVFLRISCTVESHEVDKIEVVLRRSRTLPITQNSAVAAVGYAGK
jgi:hypothetical protein